jgi:putative membrane protein
VNRIELEVGRSRPRRRRLAARALATWLGNCVGLLLAALLLSDFSYQDRLGTLLFAGAILGVVNLALRPIVVLLTLPAVILTLGGALLLINTLMLWLTSKIVPGLYVGRFWTVLAGALILWAVNMALRPWRQGGAGASRPRMYASGRRSG